MTVFEERSYKLLQNDLNFKSLLILSAVRSSYLSKTPYILQLPSSQDGFIRISNEKKLYYYEVILINSPFSPRP